VAEPPVPTAPARLSTPRTATTPAAPRGIVTDYGYVISELRRIAIITGVILLLLLVLWLLFG
jgi:hypothetical protein